MRQDVPCNCNAAAVQHRAAPLCSAPSGKQAPRPRTAQGQPRHVEEAGRTEKAQARGAALPAMSWVRV